MTTGLIFNIQRFSTEDGPGIRTTVFLKGCPMRCPWCQNPEGMRQGPSLLWIRSRCLGDAGCVAVCPHKAIRRNGNEIAIRRDLCESCGECAKFCPSEALEVAGSERTAESVAEEVARDRHFYASSGGGMTFSGGEPMAQLPFLIETLDLCGKAGIHRALDTCGAAGEAEWKQVLGRVEMVLFDLKQMDPERHLAETGIRLEKVLASARLVGRSKVTAWVRTPVIPGHTEDEENVRAIARFIRKEMPNVERYDLLAFSKLCVSKYEGLGGQYPLVRTPLVARSHMERLHEIAAAEGVRQVVWSGMTAKE